jgi:lambda repressor-like predicted transcriptional regulator
MVTRAEYLDRSLSRRKPWLAEGISRRTFERRQRKSKAVDGSQTKNSTPNEASASKPPHAAARQPGEVSARKTTPRRRARATITRAEYLERSLSRRQPWLEEGISRRTFERRQRQSKIAKSTRAKKSLIPAGRSRKKAQHAAIGPADDTSAGLQDKRILHRQDRDLLMRRIHDYWDAQGIRDGDTQALGKAIRAIELPERFKDLDVPALLKVYRRAREGLPAAYDRWIDLIEKWDRAYSRQKARDLVDRLITALADRPPRILDRMFSHLERQICDHLPKKVRRIEYECERLKNDEWHFPDFRPLKTDTIKEQVYAALADGPKTKKQLARMFGKTTGAISSVGLRLRNEGLITSIWRDGQFMWARRSTDPLFIAARDAIVEALKKGPMTVSALARETGKRIPTIKSALHRHLLANRTVIRTKFGVYALAGTQSPYVSRGDAIVAALKKGPMSFQALAREINNPPSSVPQFLEPLLAKGDVIRIKRGIYALRGSAPAYIPTSDAIVSALTKKPMKLGPLVQHVIELTKATRSRSSIRTVLSRLKDQGTVKQDRRWGEYRLGRRSRLDRGREGTQRRRGSSRS